MSFFSTGFSSMLNERRLKKAAKRGSGKAAGSSGKVAAKEEKKDEEGRWDRLTDAYGRTYWQHSVTGEWSYGVGGGLASPVLAVNPSPMMGFAGAVYIPSPIFAAPPRALAKKKSKKTMEDKKGESKKEGKGWWETVYDDDGNRCWRHTVTEKTTYKDPYY